MRAVGWNPNGDGGAVEEVGEGFAVGAEEFGEHLRWGDIEWDDDEDTPSEPPALEVDITDPQVMPGPCVVPRRWVAGR